MARYEVYVGRHGKVYETTGEESARTAYDAYVKRSLEWQGACGGEPVVLKRDGEVVAEHTPLEV